MARTLRIDLTLLIAVIALLAIGLVMVYSASAVSQPGDAVTRAWHTPFVKQSIAAALGLAAMLTLTLFDYRELRRPVIVYSILGGSLLLLVAVLFAPVLNGSRRWLLVGGFSFQPSELAKVALVLFLAYQIERKIDCINQPTFLVPAAAAVVSMAALILLEPDFGTTGLLLLLSGFLLFVSGLSWHAIGGAALVSVPLLWTLVISVPYRRDRLFAFFRPEDDPLDRGFQVLQSMMAIGSGGLNGLGLGQSLQKLHFLPMANSDFIFAILCEELGLIGGLVVLSLFALLAWRGLRAGSAAPDTFGRYLAWGLTAMVVLQALINISITLNLLPTTGAPLPLISYGGSSLVITLAACGLLLNVSQHA